jgi:hypothetical protein
MKLIVLFALIITSITIEAQEKIVLMNGQQFIGHAIDTTGLKIIFEKTKSNNKLKTKYFYKDEVFSINYDGEEKVFYFPYFAFEEEYTIDNMRMIVNGRMDARYKYKTRWVIPTGIVVGAASALLMKGSVFSLLVPLVYTGLVQIPIVKIQRKSISSPEFIGNEYYNMGYNKSARSKRTIQALIWSFSGVIAGLVVYELSN